MAEASSSWSPEGRLHRLTVAVHWIRRRNLKCLSTVEKDGLATVIVAVGHQARVIPRVHVIGSMQHELREHHSVIFDKLVDLSALSVTAGSLGAASLSLRSLPFDRPEEHTILLCSSTYIAGQARYELRIVLHRDASNLRSMIGRSPLAVVLTPIPTAKVDRLGGTPELLRPAHGILQESQFMLGSAQRALGSYLDDIATESIVDTRSPSQRDLNVEAAENLLGPVNLSPSGPSASLAHTHHARESANSKPVIENVNDGKDDLNKSDTLSTDYGPNEPTINARVFPVYVGASGVSSEHNSNPESGSHLDIGQIDSPSGQLNFRRHASKLLESSFDLSKPAPLDHDYLDKCVSAADIMSRSLSADLSLGIANSPVMPCRVVDYFCVMLSAEVPIEDGQQMDAEPLSLNEAVVGQDALLVDESGFTASNFRMNQFSAQGGSHQSQSSADGTGTPAWTASVSGEYDDSDDEARDIERDSSRIGVGIQNRRMGQLQYRYPKTDHPDFALPTNVDWFCFPDGITPIRCFDRPPVKRSAFVLSNVGGEGGVGIRVYGVCITVYRMEDHFEGKGCPLEGHRKDTSEAKLWWPVVLYMLTRFPIVPQLASVLADLYEVYDAGATSGETAAGATVAPSYCTLQEYLRMLVFEIPLPIRRLGLGTAFFLPGRNPRMCTDGICTLYLRPPTALPALQFDSRQLLAALPAEALLAAVTAAAQNRRIVIVARTVQALVEVCEGITSLLYPMTWEMPYIPVLPAHMAADCLQAPVPFIYGLLTSYACRSFAGLDAAGEGADLVVVDVSSGCVDTGTALFLARRRATRALREHGPTSPQLIAAESAVDILKRKMLEALSDEHLSPAEASSDGWPSSEALQVARLLRWPVPLHREVVAEIDVLRSEAISAPRAAGLNAALQNVMLRAWVSVLMGYRQCTFFPGLPPQRCPIFSAQSFSDQRVAFAKASGVIETGIIDSCAHARAFYMALAESQAMARLLQRHDEPHLRTFHAAYAATAAAVGGPTRAMSGVIPSMSVSSSWLAHVPAPSSYFVVPPVAAEGTFSDTLRWQAAATFLTKSSPSASNSSVTAPNLKSMADRKRKGKRKLDEYGLARHWDTATVAIAAGLGSTSESQLHVLVSDAVERGMVGMSGDDIGGSNKEAPEHGTWQENSTAATELIAHASASAGAAGPAAVRQRHKAGRGGRPGKRQTAARFDLFGRYGKDIAKVRTSGVANIANGLLSIPQGLTEAEEMEFRILAWMQSVLSLPGSLWAQCPASIEDIEHMFTSPLARATFVRVLQAQVLMSSGLGAPAQSAVFGSRLHLQPLLGLGFKTPANISAVPMDTLAVRMLCLYPLPEPQFRLLASACRLLANECADDRDYHTPAILLQAAHHLVGVPVAAGTSGRSMFLHRELEQCALWASQPFWESYVTHAITVLSIEDVSQQFKAPHVVNSNASVASSSLLALLTSLVAPMLGMGMLHNDVRAFIARMAVKLKLSSADEKSVLIVVDGVQRVAEGPFSTVPTIIPYIPTHSSTKTSVIRQSEYSVTATVGPGSVNSTPDHEIMSHNAAEQSGATPFIMSSESVIEGGYNDLAISHEPVDAIGQSSSNDLAISHEPVDAIGQSASLVQAVAHPVATVDSVHNGTGSTEFKIEPRVVSMQSEHKGVIRESEDSSIAATSAGYQNRNGLADNSMNENTRSASPESNIAAPVALHAWDGMSLAQAEAASRILVEKRLNPIGAGKEPAGSEVVYGRHSGDTNTGKTPANGVFSKPQGIPVTITKVAAGSRILGRRNAPGDTWQDKTGLPLPRIEYHPGTQVLAEASPPGDDHYISLPRLFGPEHGLVTSSLVLIGHDSSVPIRSMDIDSQDGRLATAGNDGKVVLWDTRNRQHMHSYAEASAAITAVRLSGDVVASASQGGSVRLSAFSRLAYGLCLDGADDETGATKSSHALRLLGYTGRPVHSFSTPCKLRGHTGPVQSIDLWERPHEAPRIGNGHGSFWSKASSDDPVPLLPSESAYVVVSGGADGSMRAWSVNWKVGRGGHASASSILLATHTSLHGAAVPVDSVKLSVDGRLAVSAGRDGRIGVADLAVGKVWVMMNPRKDGSGRTLFGKAALEAAPAMWNNDPSQPSTLPVITATVDVMHRPVTITSAGADGCVRTWDLRTGGVAVVFASKSPVWAFDRLPAHGAGAAMLGTNGELMSPPALLGDAYLASGHEDGLLRVWDSRRPDMPKLVMQGAASGAAVTCLHAFGDTIATGGSDGGVRVWDAENGRGLEFAGHSCNVSSVRLLQRAQTPESGSDSDGPCILMSTGWDGSVRETFATVK